MRVDITRLLQTLVRHRFLVAQGIGRGTSYRLAGEAPGSAMRGDTPPHKEPISPHKAGSPLISSPDKDAAGDQERLVALAAPVKASRRAAPELVRKVVLDLCENRFLTLRELAELLGRTKQNLRDRYITELVRDGRLELRYPDTPNHRDQGYRTRTGATA